MICRRSAKCPKSPEWALKWVAQPPSLEMTVAPMKSWVATSSVRISEKHPAKELTDFHP